jgi:hypothetical protein
MGWGWKRREGERRDSPGEVRGKCHWACYMSPGPSFPVIFSTVFLSFFIPLLLAAKLEGGSMRNPFYLRGTTLFKGTQP